MVGPQVSASASRLRFCSITDANYLAQVLVMHRSLREVLPDARDEVLCMDSRSRRVLEAIALPGLEPIGIEGHWIVGSHAYRRGVNNDLAAVWIGCANVCMAFGCRGDGLDEVLSATLVDIEYGK